MRCGVVVFPGSNCDHDVYHVLKHVLDQEVLFLWHGDEAVRDCELIVLPGGFSYGDYLRAGAMAAHSPIMPAVRRFAEEGGYVHPMFNPEYSPDSYSAGILEGIRTFVPGRNRITQQEADDWAMDLRDLGEAGEYFFSVNRYLFQAIKPGLPSEG